MHAPVKDKLVKFFSQFTPFDVERGTTLIAGNEEPDAIFLLQDGVVRQYSVTKDGEELTLNLYKPVSYFPMVWAMNKLPNRYYFETVSEAKGFKAPKKDVLDFVKDDAEILYDLASRFGMGLYAMLNRLENIMTGDAYAKIIYTLLNAAYRLGNRRVNTIVIPLQVTHRELATIGGVARETASRELKKLEQKGLITYNVSSIIINDVQKLEHELTAEQG
jgi:CRP/FNR family transcriptional regulator